MHTLATHGCPSAATLVVTEATGAYWQGVATALHTAGWAVAVFSPGSARAFARARMRRAKTNAVDAALLADYGRTMEPTTWSPPPAEVSALQLLVRQRDDLVGMRTETRCRQHALARLPAVPAAVREPLVAVLRALDKWWRTRDLIRHRSSRAVRYGERGTSAS